MSNQDQFRFCPRCGRQGIPLHPDGALRCENCQFILFINVATAVGAIIADERGRILLLRRSHEPGKGKLGLPGGFVSPGESAEEALVREVKEETNLDLASYRYLCSIPNQYPYRDILYTTADLFFTCAVSSWSTLQALDESDCCVVVEPATVAPEEIAFSSVREALRRYVGSTIR